MDFGQAIDRLFEEFGSGMVVAVEGLVGVGAFEPEIGAQINDLATEVKEGRGIFGGDAMRQGEENDLGGLGEQFGLGFAETQGVGERQMGEFRKDGATVWPANWREVTAASSAPGWRSSRRTSSSPE
jgi:hypothetical protein